MNRCLYHSNFSAFLHMPDGEVLGILCEAYHGVTLTTTIEAWKSEISIIKNILKNIDDENGQIIFEYDIPRLGKRIDVVLLTKGIVFCLEFKVGESEILDPEVGDCIFDNFC